MTNVGSECIQRVCNELSEARFILVDKLVNKITLKNELHSFLTPLLFTFSLKHYENDENPRRNFISSKYTVNKFSL